MNNKENQIIDYEEIFNDDDNMKKEPAPNLEQDVKDNNKYISSIAIYFLVMMLGLGALVASFFIKPFVEAVDYSNPTYDVMNSVYYMDNSIAVVDETDYLNNKIHFLIKDGINDYKFTVITSIEINGNNNLLITANKNQKELEWLNGVNDLDSKLLDSILTGKVNKWGDSKKDLKFVVNPESDIFKSDNFEVSNLVAKGNKVFVLGVKQNNLFINLMQISIYLMVAIPLFIMFRPSLKVDYIDFKKSDKSLLSTTLTGISYMLIVQVVLGAITLALQMLRGNVSQSVNQAAIESSMAGPSAILLILTVVILGPFVEEVIFRKSIFGLMKNDKLAIIFSGFLFGLIHLTGETHFIDILIQGIPYVGMGLFLGYFYSKNEKNLLLMTLIHSGYNLLTVIFMFLN